MQKNGRGKDNIVHNSEKKNQVYWAHGSMGRYLTNLKIERPEYDRAIKSTFNYIRNMEKG
jgi:hypothetical protein